MTEALIRLHAYEPSILTTEEFEALVREVTARLITDSPSVGDRVLCKLIEHSLPRYYEAFRQNAPHVEEPA